MLEFNHSVEFILLEIAAVVCHHLGLWEFPLDDHIIIFIELNEVSSNWYSLVRIPLLSFV